AAWQGKETRQEEQNKSEQTVTKGKRIGKKELLLLLSGALIGMNWILLFDAYNHTSVQVATLCYYMQPTLVMLLSVPVFKEKMTAKRLFCCLLAALGMVLVSGVLTGESTGDGLGIAMGLGAAVLYSMVVLLNKSLAGINLMKKTMAQLLSAAFVLLPYLLWTEKGGLPSFTGKELFILLVVGIFHTGICYALYFGSMDALPAQTVALYSYIDPVTALLLSALLLGESLTGQGILGAIFILGAALLGDRWTSAS
ncbi:MAG: DMT family transporter, partial [Blautia sp.]|nr:DMT family transporter [Blautia sp.]